MVEAILRPVMTRAGTMIVQQWKQAGIDAKVDVAQGTLPTRRAAGDFDTFIGWSVETWEAIRICPTSWIAGIRSSSPSPANRSPTQLARWSSPALDKIIEETRTIGFDDPKSIELGKDYVKLAVKEMPTFR